MEKADAETRFYGDGYRPESDALGRHAGLRAGIHYRSSRVVPRLRPADIGATWSTDSGFRRNDELWPKVAGDMDVSSVGFQGNV